MKKFLIIGFLILIVLAAATIWVLNYLEIINVSSWGERAVETLVNAPYIREHATFDDDYEQLEEERQLLLAEIEQLEDENYMLTVDFRELEEELNEREEEIEGLQEELMEIQDVEMAREEQLERLLAIYSEMDPYDAAPIFNNMDRELALLILSQIDVERAAIILPELESALAAELTFFLERLGEEDYEDIAAEYEARLEEQTEEVDGDDLEPDLEPMELPGNN